MGITENAGRHVSAASGRATGAGDEQTRRHDAAAGEPGWPMTAWLPVAVPVDRHGALHTADLSGEFVVHLVFDIDSDTRTVMARQ